MSMPFERVDPDVSVPATTDPGAWIQSAESATTSLVTSIASAQPRVLEALVARYGPEVGGEATDEAVAWALAHTDRLGDVRNLVAYLYRVGQSKARPSLRWRARRADPLADDAIVATEVRPIDPSLVDALRKLTPDQRAAVLLVHAYGWTIAEVADLRGVAVTAVTNHLRRGLISLRKHLPEDTE
jgi:RNA polymerase sigma-70 factor, ECF subfamily